MTSTPTSVRRPWGSTMPALLPDAAAVVARVSRARDRGERVLVVGDFDADGLTGLAILVTAFRRLGLDVATHVPSRLDEGHGLSLQAVAAAREGGRSLLFTVDTGSSSVAEVAAAARGGIDVIVTDHHRVPEVAPAALALVNPHRPDSAYPDRRLAGSGVALKVAALLLERLAGVPAVATVADLADLAAIGTVADVAPILGENRSIARLGLERLRTAPRPGIAALLASARVDPASVTLETIAFVIAPRLNAAGRVGDAVDAAALLLAETAEEARVAADALERANDDAARHHEVGHSRGPHDPRRRGPRPSCHARPGTVAGRRRGTGRGAPGRGAGPPGRRGGGAGRRAAGLVPGTRRLRPRRHARRLRGPPRPTRRPPRRRWPRGA